MNKREKEILKLKEQGFKQSEIAKKLNCSSSLVNYYLNPKEREAVKQRTKKRDQSIVKLEKRICSFNHNRKGHNITAQNADVRGYTVEDVKKHIGWPIGKCYITGIPIDFTKDDYHLDHIIPVSKGGDNSLENMGAVIPQVNMMKAALTKEELISLCTSILTKLKYKVLPPEV